MAYNPEYMTSLQNGSVIQGMEKVMTDRMGDFWYLAVFAMPAVYVWLKTEDTSMFVFVLTWTIALFGPLINPDGWTTPAVAVLMAVGIMSLIVKVMWRD